MKKTAKYYNSEEGKAAYKKKLAYDKKHNQKPENVKKRTELNKYNRDKGTYGNNDSRDARHLNGKIVGFIDQSKNRASKSDSSGDKRARGTKKRK